MHLTPEERRRIDAGILELADNVDTRTMIEWALNSGDTSSGLLRGWTRSRIDHVTRGVREIFDILTTAERNHGRYKGAILRINRLRHSLEAS
jgi:hypothetical protein